MAVVHTNKKRDRVLASSSSHHHRGRRTDSAAAAPPDEYERAVAFLREFHSRRVAAYSYSYSSPLSSSSTSSSLCDASRTSHSPTPAIDDLVAMDDMPSSSSSSSKSNHPLDAIFEDGDDDDDVEEEDGANASGENNVRLVIDEMLSGDFALALGIGNSSPWSPAMTSCASSSSSPIRMRKANTTKCLLELGGGCDVDEDDDETTTTTPSYYSHGSGDATTDSIGDDYFCHDLPSTKRSRGRYLVY